MLQTRQVEQSHTSDNVTEELQAVASEWSLENKIAGVTTNNARNIVAGVHKLMWQHFACFAHTLNIALKRGLRLQAVSTILSRCRKLVGHFKHSYVAQSALESKQTEYEHKLIQDVPTRWNSAFKMIERILEQEKAIAAVLLNSRKARGQDLILTSTELS